MVPAVELVGEKEFDKLMAGKATVAQIKENREKCKSEFEVERCNKCHDKGTAFWGEPLC
jgi:hypothetical protein